MAWRLVDRHTRIAKIAVGEPTAIVTFQRRCITAAIEENQHLVAPRERPRAPFWFAEAGGEGWSAGATVFTPTAGVSESVTLDAGTGSYFVWIGATLTAAGVVAPGNYTQPITLEVFYN